MPNENCAAVSDDEKARDTDTPGAPLFGQADHQAQLAPLLQALSGRVGKTQLKVLVSETVRLVERHYIEAALARTQGNRSAAAKMLGLSRQSLYVKLARYGIGDD